MKKCIVGQEESIKTSIIMQKIIAFVIFIILLGFGGWYYSETTNQENKNVKKTEIPISITIKNEEKDYKPCCGLLKPYKIDFIKIRSVGFGADAEKLYIRFDLAGKMPTKDETLPKFTDDQVTGAMYYLSLDENYYDGEGFKNPGGPEAYLRIGFYGAEDKDSTTNKIRINGDLVEGGAGYDYFIVSYPYNKVLINQFGSNLVFTATGLAISEKYKAGASRSDLTNKEMMADKDPKEILIKIGLGKP